jgi:hypothetical protein
MSERDEELRIPQQENRQDGGGDATAEGHYRKAEEDETMLREEERTGEGTGARAGEYS